jgi:hypothetical protein
MIKQMRNRRTELGKEEQRLGNTEQLVGCAPRTSKSSAQVPSMIISVQLKNAENTRVQYTVFL